MGGKPENLLWIEPEQSDLIATCCKSAQPQVKSARGRKLGRGETLKEQIISGLPHGRRGHPDDEKRLRMRTTKASRLPSSTLVYSVLYEEAARPGDAGASRGEIKSGAVI